MIEVKYKLIPAGILLRAVAFGIDTGIVLGGFYIIINFLTPFYGDDIMYFGIIILPFYYLYYAILESSAARATLGKRLLGLRVVDLNGRRLGFWQALGRNLSKAASQFCFGIGFLMAAWTEKKQALHDKMAGALVMKRIPVYISPQARPAPLSLNRVAEVARRGADAAAAHDFTQYHQEAHDEESHDDNEYAEEGEDDNGWH